jgi:conjugative relaxase-like TrwC/TraI family protein
VIKITKLGTTTAHNYFEREFAAASNSYYAHDGSVYGRWNGALAAKLGLSGRVTEEAYHRLVDGQHPLTGDQLVQHRDNSGRMTKDGKREIASHIPAWDVTLSLPKSWSIAAIVGGDERIYRIAERALQEALSTLQTYAQARGGGNHLPINTAQWLVATFRHETSRPVDGYSAPQIHFHNVLMNLTQDNSGKFRSLQTAEIYKAKSFAVAAFYASLARQGRELGYEIDFTADEFQAPEIRGISRAYIEHESPRREEQILPELERRGWSGGKAADVIAAEGREEKLELSPEAMIARQVEHGKQFADELQLVRQALERGPVKAMQPATPPAAVTFAVRALSERHATFEHYELGREALRYAQGTVSREAIEGEVQRRVEAGELVPVHHYRAHAPGARYTTAEMLELERDTIRRVLAGMNRVEPILQNADLSRYKQLAGNPQRQQILRDFLATRDHVVGLNGTAGSAKSTAAGILKKVAESQGYRVKGLAPTGKAVNALKQQGLEADTLQMQLVQPGGKHISRKSLYIVDETSLASTRNLNAFLKTLGPQDHVILVGDDAPSSKKVGQHTSVEAGRVFQLLQEAGMKTAHFNRVFRQKDPELKQVVLAFRNGQTDHAIELLGQQARIHEHDNRRERYAAIAKAYAEAPERTLVVSPDNQSRMELNAVIRQELRRLGLLAKREQAVPILVARDSTASYARRAAFYRVGDTIQYRKANKEVGVRAKEYATVLAKDVDRNRITVQTQHGRIVTYDPVRASGVSLFESVNRSFAAGERIQFTARDKKLGVTTRDTGTVRDLDAAGNVRVELDGSNRQVKFNLLRNRHIDHAYSMTSHSAQSITADRALLNVDTSDPRLRALLNDVFAYVAGSRPEYDLQIFADNAAELARVLSRQNEEQKALAPEQIAMYRDWQMGLEQEYGIGI